MCQHKYDIVGGERGFTFIIVKALCSHLMLLNNLQQPDPLVIPGLVSKLHQYVGVKAEHDGQGYHKYDQKHSGEVSLLHALGPPNEVAGAFLPDCWFC